MELSVLCLLTVALAFGPLHSAHGVPSEKPGVCPRLILPFTDRRLCQRPCTSDSDCPGILKCCFSACGRVCLKPERVVPEPKPGSCPRPNRFGTCVNSCSSDSDCEKDLKCCSNGCGRVCMKPVREPVEKPGVCPGLILEFEDLSVCPMQCTSDSDCEKDLKCCFGGCGRTCMKPVRVVPEPKPGSCPRPNHFGTCVNSCSSDSDCEKDLKCCSNGCGRVCMKPVRVPVEKPGVCPKVIMPFAGYDWGQHKEKCTTDWQCPRKQKCCNIGLQRCCVDPEPDIVPEPKCGSCPRPHHCRYCKNDNDCPKSLKCCFNGRKAICTKPVGGCCPPFNVLKHEDECQHDHECPKKLKCCYNKCNRRKTCTEPTKTSNPGCCPGFHKCNTCVHDSDCHGNLKCCPNKCNVNTCTASIKGSCPLIKIMECKDECSDDCDCEKPLKCCYNHCEGRRTCVMPADSNMSSSEESYSVGK
ncbi:uncharacterized protein [Eucyclogobius newberryi]|uniref:uncharacterized protein n=1 Tax=Eucyclogobius newberryi TaxID=166745 RepID=UPI003B5C8DEC